MLSTRSGEKVNGCITNTCMQVANDPVRIAISVLNSNYTCDLIKESGIFALSLLDVECSFETNYKVLFSPCDNLLFILIIITFIIFLIQLVFSLLSTVNFILSSFSLNFILFLFEFSDNSFYLCYTSIIVTRQQQHFVKAGMIMNLNYLEETIRTSKYLVWKEFHFYNIHRIILHVC